MFARYCGANVGCSTSIEVLINIRIRSDQIGWFLLFLFYRATGWIGWSSVLSRKMKKRKSEKVCARKKNASYLSLYTPDVATKGPSEFVFSRRNQKIEKSVALRQ